MTMKKIQAEIELIPKTDKMDAYLKKMKTSSVGTGATGGATGENIGSGIITQLSTLLGEGLVGSLSTALSGIVTTIIEGITAALGSGVAAIVGAIIFLGGLILGFLVGLGIQGLMKIISGINSGMEGVMSILEIIGKMIGMMIMPFVNLLIPLLIPLLYILTPFIKILNMLLMPLMMLMMKVFGQFGSNIAGLLMKFFAGEIDLPQLIQGVMDEVVKLINDLKPALESLFIDFVQPLIEFANDFLTLDMDKIKETLVDLLGEDLGNAVGMLIDMFYYVVSALAGFVVGLVGEDTAKGFGLDVDKIKEENKGFGDGVNLGQGVLSLYNNLMEWAEYIQTTIMPIISTLAGYLITLTEEELKEWGERALEIGNFIASKMLPAIQGFYEWFMGTEGTPGVLETTTTFFKNLGDLVSNLLEWWQGEDGLDKMASYLGEAFGYFAKILYETDWKGIISSAIKSVVKASMDFVGGAVKGFTGKTEDDFIMKPNGQVLSFSPYDTIMGFRNPTGGVGGAISGSSSNSQTINITINGDVSGQELIRKVKTEMEKINRNDLMRRGVGIGGY